MDTDSAKLQQPVLATVHDASTTPAVVVDTAPPEPHVESSSVSIGDLVASTRPPQERTVSELSTVTQPASTLRSEPPVPTPVLTPQAAIPDADVDPNLAALQAMFPDFDVAILQSVLDSVVGNQERAIDMLLGMSDPEYQPVSTTTQPTQADLDEELARRLYLEDQEDQQRYESRVSQNRPQQQSRYPGTTQNQQQSGLGDDIGSQFKNLISGAQAKFANSGFGRGGSGNSQGAIQGSQTQPDIGKQLGDIAETGRKHFNTIFTKVKAKIQEYDQGNGQPSASRPPNSNSESYYAQNPSYTQPNSRYNTKPAQQQPGNLVYIGQTQDRPQATLSGYTVTHPSMPKIGTPEQTSAANPFDEEIEVPKTKQSSSEQQSSPPRASFDTSRLGLKPKRPVSLVGSNSTVQAGSTNAKGKDRANSDDIEYEQSPFDDR